MNKNIPSSIFATILAVVLVFAGYCEWNALTHVKTAPPPPRTIGKAFCTSCHSDAASLRAMKLKEGNTHFIFHGEALPQTTTAPASRWLQSSNSK
jgi:hypothetical protein